jgi:glycerate kinase
LVGVRLVIAPDKFKGTLSAREVAGAIAAGVRRARSDATIDVRPMADGGEGTVEALRAGMGGRLETHIVPGPLCAPLPAPLVRFRDAQVALEAASAAGLWLFDGRPFDGLDASTHGVGDLMRRAVAHGHTQSIIVGVGGTATTDGGTGAAAAVGWRFMDARGGELRPCGRRLTDIARIHRPRERIQCRVLGACDVTNPLLGDHGAARVFAPQKGASEDDVALLEEGLSNLAGLIRNDLGLDVADVPGAGAGGGLGAGLVAFFDAELRRGFDLVADASGLQHALDGAEAVITGEGRLDRQSLAGKTAIGVARAARTAGVPCHIIAGEVELDGATLRAEGIASAVSLVERAGAHRAMHDPATALADAAAELVAKLEAQEPL